MKNQPETDTGRTQLKTLLDAEIRPLNKMELIQAIKEKADLTKQEAEDVLKIFVDSLEQAMINGERIEIRGLCSFYIKEYESYTGRNPKTGEKVKVDGKKLPFFKAGKELRERVDYPNKNHRTNMMKA